jgi:tetratricopeptide (TPR) repeat protein
MTKRVVFLTLVLLLITHLIGAEVLAQTAEEWRRDIDILTAKIEKYHPVPWARISREAFIGRAERIKASLPDWDKEQTILEVVALVASLRDGHTSVLLSNQSSFNMWFPIRLEKFHDGIFITAVDTKNSILLGAKVLRMGKLDAETAFRRIGTITPSDSDFGIARLATNFLSNAVILQTLGIIHSQKLLPLEVVLSDGKQMNVSVPSAKWRLNFGLSYNKNRIPTNNKSQTIFHDKKDRLPLYLKKVIPSFDPYWFEYIPDDKMLYMQYNSVTNWNKEPFKDFTKRVFKTYDEKTADIEKFVIDIRFNSGGNGYLLRPFVHEFILRKDTLSRGKLYIITGTHTFSAASNLIGQMLKHTDAITVGDIAAGPLNWCSDTLTFALPNSKLRLNLSTMYWQEGHPTDDRGYYPPDYFVPETFKDYISLFDPVLEAIKNNKVTPLSDILLNDGAGKFMAEFQSRRKLYGPTKGWFPYTSFDLILLTIFNLTPSNKRDEALAISKLNAELYPEDMRAMYFLAQGYEQKGLFDKALGCYEKLLEIEPHIPEANTNYFNLNLLNAFADKGIGGVAKSYKELKKTHPNEINEGLLNNFGYRKLREKKFQEAIQIFNLNVKLHPDYANGYDSLGEAYMAKGENELAIRNYKKSLELDPQNDNAVQMLKKLKKKN